MTPYHEALTQALMVDAQRVRCERRTARSLHTEIKAMGYTGGYQHWLNIGSAGRLNNQSELTH